MGILHTLGYAVSLMGIGAFCYYSCRPKKPRQPCVPMNFNTCPTYLKSRAKLVGLFFGAELGMAVMYAGVGVTDLNLLSIMTSYHAEFVLGTILTGAAYWFCPSEWPVSKTLVWSLHVYFIGGVITPLCNYSNLFQIVLLSALTVGALGCCAASARFGSLSYLAAPSAIFKFALCSSIIGSIRQHSGRLLAQGMNMFAIYGGLFLFVAYFVYDTQEVFRICGTNPLVQRFDHITPSLPIFWDAIGIFVCVCLIVGTKFEDSNPVLSFFYGSGEFIYV